MDIERPGELLDYLRAKGRIAADEPPQFRVLAGGVSNRTVLVQRPDGQAWVIKQALAKLRTQADWFSDPSRVHREALGLRWLEKLAPPGSITPLVFEDHAHHLLAMQAVSEPHENWKTMLLDGRLEMRHVDQFAELLAAIHHGSTKIPDLRKLFDDRSFFESLRLEPYYAYAAEQVPAARSFLEGLIADTRRRRVALVHGDYSPKNILVRRDRLILLDHEVIHWGDPSFDIGFALTHFLSKAHHRDDGRFLDAAARFVEVYRANAEFDEALGVRHTLGCMLARVAGRSPLEYLNAVERDRQRRVAVELMSEQIAGVGVLISRFAREFDAEG